jgi:hypothetical protein
MSVSDVAAGAAPVSDVAAGAAPVSGGSGVVTTCQLK